MAKKKTAEIPMKFRTANSKCSRPFRNGWWDVSVFLSDRGIHDLSVIMILIMYIMCIIDHDCALMPFPSAQHDPVNICEPEYGRHRASEHFARAPSVFEPHGRGIGDPFLTKKNGDSQERQRKLHNLTQKGNVTNKHHRAWLGTCCLFLLRIYWGGSPSQQPFISKMKLSPLQQAHCSWLVMGISPLRAHCICKNDAYRHVYLYLTMSMCLHVCVRHKKARAPVRVRVCVRWGTLQRPMKDAAMFMCKHACFYIL